jgi:hypothetical protein
MTCFTMDADIVSSRDEEGRENQIEKSQAETLLGLTFKIIFLVFPLNSKLT